MSVKVVLFLCNILILFRSELISAQELNLTFYENVAQLSTNITNDHQLVESTIKIENDGLLNTTTDVLVETNQTSTSDSFTQTTLTLIARVADLNTSKPILVYISSNGSTESTVFTPLSTTEASLLSTAHNKGNRLYNISSQKNPLSEFPSDFMSEEVRNNGGVIVHILILIYLCLALAIVCDAYFISSLEFISDCLKLPSDIAGATFMAIGTSAPELFTSIIGVFISEDDIGTGTIVGSAVFNLIAIPGACGFAAYLNLDEAPRISAFPIIRDSIFYALTVITLILCIKDNQVDWVESLTLLSLYGVYIVVMYFNAQISNVIKEHNCRETEEKTPLIRKSPSSSIEDETAYREDLSRIELTKSQNGKYHEVRPNSKVQNLNGYNGKLLYNDDSDDSIDSNDSDWTDNIVIKCLMFPVVLLFKITLPKPTKFCFAITFIMSIIWIAVLTYLSVWMVTIIGYTIGMPDTVAGITILAAGTSIPELISSYIIVKRAGLADMAICNSIGSNIFDILFCLGVPWLIKSIILLITKGAGLANLANTSIPIQSSALPLTSLTLLVTIVAMIVTFKVTKWRLGLSVGVICTVIYIIFVTVSTVMEIKI